MSSAAGKGCDERGHSSTASPTSGPAAWRSTSVVPKRRGGKVLAIPRRAGRGEVENGHADEAMQRRRKKGYGARDQPGLTEARAS